jgi:peptidoglycan/LPS O-acetylase OafA/YrhL
MAATNGRVDCLDGLRCIAVCSVIVHHYAPAQSPLNSLGIPWGAIGIQLFFVLSGFIITSVLSGPYAVRGPQPFSALVAFYISRVLRIFPLVYISVAFLALFAFAGNDVNFYLHSLTMTVAYYANSLGYFPPFTGHFWTLTAEMAFYLTWPLIWMMTPPAVRLWVALACYIAAFSLHPFLIADGKMPWVLPAVRMDAFLLGATVATLVHSPYRTSVMTGLAIAGCWLSIVALVADARGLRPIISLVHTLNILFAGVVLWAATTQRASFLTARPVVYIGLISFGLYVWHMVLRVLIPYVNPVLGLPTGLAWIWLVPLLLAVASFTYAYVETPTRRISAACRRRLLEASPTCAPSQVAPV